MKTKIVLQVKPGIFRAMKKVLLLIFLNLSFKGYAQVSVDTTDGNVIITQKAKPATKSLSIYRMYIPGRGTSNLMVYEPDSYNYGDDPDTLVFNLATELLHTKELLDVALKYKHFNFYRFAFDINPYRDLIGKLVDIYAGSKEWNDYLQKAGNLQMSSTLFDGNQVTEIKYDKAIADNILAKSDFAKMLNDFFQPYGYKLTVNGFPDDHQQIVSRAELRSLGKPESLFIPIPNNYFTMTKIK